MKTIRTNKEHTHEYIPHSRWDTHYTCRICGFAAPRRMIDRICPNLIMRQQAAILTRTEPAEPGRNGDETMKTTKKVQMNLVGLNGNAYALMGAFQENARRQGWTAEEIKAVMDKMKGGNYDNLLCVLMEHTEETEDEDD